MKIRSDYVSNSSSSSFVVSERPVEAARMFLDDFSEFLEGAWNDPLGETFKIGYKKPGDEWFDYCSPDGFCWGVERGNMKLKGEEYDDEGEVIELPNITDLSFECDDYDNTAMMYLRFLYKYFEKFGFKPDDTNSEQEFRDGDCLLGKLLDRINNGGKGEDKE